jgi:hypothetical protein
MSKRNVLYFILLAFSASASFAGIVSDDGYLTAGEYDYSAWLENFDELFVQGGGAYEIIAKDHSYVEVQYTSTPLGLGVGGILDIIVDDESHLLNAGGLTGEISIYGNATATLKGGIINYIRSFQLADEVGNITIECLDDWSWMESSGDIFGIAGQWADGASFDIEFFDQTYYGYDPVWENINVVVVPEPATLLLISVGAILLRKRRA